MPEGVEVCLTAQYLNLKLKNWGITKTKIKSGKYSHKAIPGSQLLKKNEIPLTITKVDSKGKLMWFEMTDKNGDEVFLISSFGLVGHWGFEKEKYSHIEMTLKKGKEEQILYYSDHRNFGNLSWTNQRDKLTEKLDELKPDVLKETFTDAEFYRMITAACDRTKLSGKLIIVKALMEQGNRGLVSGIGNYLQAEILYRAKLHPETPLCDLKADEEVSNRLARAIRFVTKLSYLTNKSGYMEHFDHFFEERDQLIADGKLPIYHPDEKIPKGLKFEYNVYRKKKDPYGNAVKVDKFISGRSTYWVPEVQEMP